MATRGHPKQKREVRLALRVRGRSAVRIDGQATTLLFRGHDTAGTAGQQHGREPYVIGRRTGRGRSDRKTILGSGRSRRDATLLQMPSVAGQGRYNDGGIVVSIGRRAMYAIGETHICRHSPTKWSAFSESSMSGGRGGRIRSAPSCADSNQSVRSKFASRYRVRKPTLNMAPMKPSPSQGREPASISMQMHPRLQMSALAEYPCLLL